jgi:hypothetical protein
MSRVNEVTDALSTGPSTGYSTLLIFVHIIQLFTAAMNSYAHKIGNPEPNPFF